MKLKRMFSLVGTLAMLMSVVFFVWVSLNQSIFLRSFKMKLKRMFSSVGTLAMLMSVVFLISGCKSQTQRGQGDSEQVTITYSTEHGTAPASKQVDKNYKLTAGDLPSLSATGFVFEGWYIGTRDV